MMSVHQFDAANDHKSLSIFLYHFERMAVNFYGKKFCPILGKIGQNALPFAHFLIKN
jgi:hypothetical protein